MDINEQKVFDFLDELRDSGAINMLGAADYIRMEFYVSRSVAKELLLKWMKEYRP